MEKKIGIALEGGGAKGAFHVGAIKALQENGYEIQGAVGTSIGAFNAAFISQGRYEMLYDLWDGIEPSHLFDVEDEAMKKMVKLEIDRQTVTYLFDKTKEVIGNRGINTTKLRSVVDELIDEQILRESEVDFGLVTYSLSDRKPVEVCREDIPEGQLKDYIMASAAFPGFKVEPFDGKVYIDGGIHDNCPVKLLVNKGYKRIFAIRTVTSQRGLKHDGKDVEIINIVPSEELGRILVFDNDLIKKNIQLGYYDTLKVIKGLKGTNYYIQPHEEDLFFEVLQSVPNEVIEQLAIVLKVPQMQPKRMLFEKMIPTIAELLKLPTTATYQDIFIGLLETIAIEKKINRFKVYTVMEFIQVIEQTMPLERIAERRRRHLLGLKQVVAGMLGKNLLNEVAYVFLDLIPKTHKGDMD